MPEQLEQLYLDARIALKSKDFDRASDLLRQILLENENYKDASRLLAQTVNLRRRRWYTHPLMWGGLSLTALIGLGVWLAPWIATLALRLVPTPVATGSLAGASLTPSPTSTPIPLAWQRINLGLQLPRDTITSIAIDPFDQDVIYIGTANAGILYSIDGGLSWQPTFFNLGQGMINSLAIDTENEDIFYVGLPYLGLFQTRDGGNTWRQILVGGRHILVVIDPHDNQHLFCYGSIEEALYVTHNAGESWYLVPSSGQPYINNLVIDSQDGNKLYAYGSSRDGRSGIFVSDDSGENWRLETTNNTGPLLFGGAEGLYILNEEKLYHLDDDQLVLEKSGFPDVREGFLLSLARDPDTFYVGGQSFWISNDGGVTWAERNNGLGAARLDLFYNQKEEILYLETLPTLYADCSLYRSLNDGVEWDELESPGCSLTLDAAGSVLYQDNYRSMDGGTTWESLSLPGNGRYPKAHPTQTGVVYTVMFNNAVILTADYGLTWDIAGSLINDADVRLFFGQGSRSYAVSSDFIEKSSDGGKTWEFCTNYEKIPVSKAASRMIVRAGEPDQLMLATRGRGILLSKDNCQSWHSSNKGLDNFFVNSIAIDPNNPDKLFAGTDGGVYVSTNNGETWGLINDGLLGATVIYSIVVDFDSNVYAATPYGIFMLDNR